MIYLASPYTHPDPRVHEARFDAACVAAAALVRARHVVFSPIVHGHPLARFALPIEWEYWERFDREYLRRCDGVVAVLGETGRFDAALNAVPAVENMDSHFVRNR